MKTRLLSLLALLLVALLATHTLLAPRSLAQEQEAATEDTTEEEIPPGLETYMGREIAQTMHFDGADWLVRESREREEDCTTMLANLGVEPGMTVCDMGCGNGFYTLKLGEMVGEDGSVLAVDIQPEMLEKLRERAHVNELENIELILGTIADPKLPAGEVDIILCVDVYHEFSHPVHMLEAMRESLAPGGRLVLVEFRAEDPNVPIRELHKMSRQQMLREMSANGFELADEFEDLPWQHMMFFEVAENEATEDGAAASGSEMGEENGTESPLETPPAPSADAGENNAAEAP